MRDYPDPPARLRAAPAPALPVARLVIGKPVSEVAALVPRLFNLCRAAQATALNRALGLPDSDTDVTAEIIRDHILKLCVALPARFGPAPRLAPGLLTDRGAALHAVFGPAGLPRSGVEMQDFLGSGHGVAPLLSRISGCFGPGDAVATGLPLVDGESAFTAGAVENNPAARRNTHPGLAWVEATHGRGMLWRCVGRAVDLAMALDGDLPALELQRSGAALVHATRGLYAVTASVEDGLVDGFARVTPTDHLLAPGGVLERTLSTLPADRSGMAALILDILDPCNPIRLVTSPEVAHA